MSDLTPSKLDELRRLAAIAADATTERTPWYTVDDLTAYGIESEEDAPHIAAFAPPIVLALRDAAENQDILIGSVNHYKTDRDELAAELAHMTEARDNARAEVERLTAKLESVRAECAQIARECDAGFADPYEVRPVVDRITAALGGEADRG